jgi:hypothetical protein
MPYCFKYREIAEAHDALFQRMNADNFHSERVQLHPQDQEELCRTMAQLDDHVLHCSQCRLAQSRAAISRA